MSQAPQRAKAARKCCGSNNKKRTVMPQPLDPHQINERVQTCMDVVLDCLEHIDPMEPKADALLKQVKMYTDIALEIARTQLVFVGLRKENQDEPERAGSAVRRFQASFAAAGTRQRMGVAGPASDETITAAITDPDPDGPAA